MLNYAKALFLKKVIRFYSYQTVFLILLIVSCGSKPTDTYVIETTEGNMTIKLYDDTPEHKANFQKLVKEDFYDGLLFHRVIENFMIQTGDPESRNAQPGQRLGSGGPGYTIEAEIKDNHFHKKGALAAARTSDNINPERRSSGSQFYIVQGTVIPEKQLITDRSKVQDYLRMYLDEPQNTSLKQQVVNLQRARKYNEMEQLLIQYADTLEVYYDVSFEVDIAPEKVKAYSTIGGAPHLDGQYTVFGEVIDGLEVIDKIASKPTDQNDNPQQPIIIKDIKPL